MTDCIIIGGGVAGLTLSLQLVKQGASVAVIENHSYPFHKVCGEYVSNESVDFLARLGLDLQAQPLPFMDTLLLTSVSGISITRPLDIGGIGISRHSLDSQLAGLARNCGVQVFESTLVSKVEFTGNAFRVHIMNQVIEAKVVCGCYGRKSNLDAQLHRQYRAVGNDLYIGVKYHIRTDYDPRFVELHNFKDGYCGLSAIEDGKTNLSYISKAKNLRESGNSIPAMEASILSRNPNLRRYFSGSDFLYDRPLVISHVSFSARSPVDDHILMVGDSSGSIAPLSGNGMSIAMRSAKLASREITSFLQGNISRSEMEIRYGRQWNQLFRRRIAQARVVQSIFGKPLVNNLSFSFLKAFPFLVDLMSKNIHGHPF